MLRAKHTSIVDVIIPRAHIDTNQSHVLNVPKDIVSAIIADPLTPLGLVTDAKLCKALYYNMYYSVSRT